MPTSFIRTTAFAKAGILPTQAIALQQPINFIPIFLNNNIYLFNYADKARWASGQLIDADNTTNNTSLTFMGSEGDSNGFVRLDDGVLMEDNQKYKALRTHPKWVNNGCIKGWFPWVQQSGTGTFKAQVGFLNGATGTDGVTFQVWVHYRVGGVEHWESVLHQQKLYTGQLQEVSADLAKWANQEIYIELRVDAGASSGRDWAAWINPRIEMGQAVKIPGPVITNDNPVFFNDRYEEKTKWYLPDFQLKQPLKDNFSFSCYKNAEPDINAKSTYGGEVSFTIVKNMPTAIISLVATNDGITYNEITLNHLNINFVLAFKEKQPVTYSGIIAQNNNEYTLTLKPDAQLQPKDQEAYLLILFNFISNSDNASYCTIAVSGSYLGYIPKPQPVRLKLYQNAFRLKQMQSAHLESARPLLNLGASKDGMLLRSRINTRPVETTVDETIVDHPLVDYITNDSLLFTKVISNVNYPCSGAGGYPTNYIVKDNNATVSFACHPPFGDPAANNHTYVEFSPQNTLLTNFDINNIYLNTYNFNYLIIPEKYVIMLERASNANSEDPLVPAVYLNTIIDDTDTNNCTATFTFHVAPDITAYRLQSIKKLIFDNTKSGTYKSIDDVIIEFPDTIHQPESIIVDKVQKMQITSRGACEYGIPGSQYFQVEFQDVKIGDGSAGLIADTIKGQMGGASKLVNISFAVDTAAGTPAQSYIELSLNKISGNGLLLQKNEADNKVYFLNKTFYDISVTAFTSDTETVINPAVAVSKNNSVLNPSSVQVPLPVTADNYLSVIPKYIFNPGQEYNNSLLAEMRVDVQNVTDSIIVTNNTGLFTMYNIKQLDIIIYILPAGETEYSKALLTRATSIIADGVINYVPFVLPVGPYSSKWSAVYSTNIIFADGTNQQNNVQIIEDLNSIGKVINLTVSNLNLVKS